MRCALLIQESAKLLGIHIRIAHQVSQQARFERAMVRDRQRLSRGIRPVAHPDVAAALPHDAIAELLEDADGLPSGDDGSPDVIG